MENEAPSIIDYIIVFIGLFGIFCAFWGFGSFCKFFWNENGTIKRNRHNNQSNSMMDDVAEHIIQQLSNKDEARKNWETATKPANYEDKEFIIYKDGKITISSFQKTYNNANYTKIDVEGVGRFDTFKPSVHDQLQEACQLFKQYVGVREILKK